MGSLSASRELRYFDGISSAPVATVKVLSTIQIIIGCVSLVAQGLFTGIMLLHLQPGMRHFLISFGIWAGILFIITGTIGLRLRKTYFISLPHPSSKHTSPRTLITCYITLNIISAICAASLVAINLINLIWLGDRPLIYAPFYVIRHADIFLYQPLTGTLTVAGAAGLIVSCLSAALCCSFGVRYSKGHRLRSSSLRRARSFIDYPSSTLESRGGLAGRVRSYSQSSLVQPPRPVSQGQPSHVLAGAGPAPYASAPPPSYDEVWDGVDDRVHGVCGNSRSGSRERWEREGRSNARVHQNLQMLRTSSRSSF